MQVLLPEILRWVNSKDFNPDNCSSVSPIGCFLNVDLNYPKKLLDLRYDYPLASETNKSNR